LPAPLPKGSAHAGRWYARLGIEPRYYKRFLSTLDNQPAAHATAAAHGILYNFNVHAYSNLRMRGSLSQTGNEPGATTTVRAVLTEYGVPVAGRATCRVELTRPDQSLSTLVMAEVQPGAFEVPIAANAQGIYQFRILAEGRTLRGLPFTREQMLSGAVWRGGDDKPPSVYDDPRRDDERLCQLLFCVLGNKGVLELLKRHGVDHDELRRCLAAYCRRPSPGEAVTRSTATLERRLRGIIRDDETLAAVLEAVARSKD
jgi:hypothetical protein